MNAVRVPLQAISQPSATRFAWRVSQLRWQPTAEQVELRQTTTTLQGVDRLVLGAHDIAAQANIIILESKDVDLVLSRISAHLPTDPQGSIGE